MNPKYFTLEFWDKIFCDMGFREHQGGTLYRGWESKKFMVNVFLYTRGIEYQWVVKGERSKVFVTPAVAVYEDGSKDAWQRLKEMELMIEVVSDPSKAPLLAGVDWAGGIMERLLLSDLSE